MCVFGLFRLGFLGGGRVREGRGGLICIYFCYWVVGDWCTCCCCYVGFCVVVVVVSDGGVGGLAAW